MERETKAFYNAVGNRQRVTDNGQITGYTANHLNQYTVVDGSTLSYDANGNLSNTVAGVLGDWTYTYDAQNRLIRATGGPSSVVAEFYYDARNRCVKRVINGVTTYLIYDGWSLLEERNLAGNLLARYYHGPVIDELLCRVTETNTVYYHHDGLGSTVALTDSTGNVVESYTYDVYGQPSFLSATYHLLPTSSVTNRFLFTGREYLADLALYDYRHRFYSPSLGRFLQTDPLRFDAEDVNLYRYVENNAVNIIDPLGLKKCFDEKHYNTCKAKYEINYKVAVMKAKEIFVAEYKRAEDLQKKLKKDCDKRYIDPLDLALCYYSAESTAGKISDLAYKSYLASLYTAKLQLQAGMAACWTYAWYDVPDNCPCDPKYKIK